MPSYEELCNFKIISLYHKLRVHQNHSGIWSVFLISHTSNIISCVNPLLFSPLYIGSVLCTKPSRHAYNNSTLSTLNLNPYIMFYLSEMHQQQTKVFKELNWYFELSTLLWDFQVQRLTFDIIKQINRSCKRGTTNAWVGWRAETNISTQNMIHIHVAVWSRSHRGFVHIPYTKYLYLYIYLQVFSNI